MTVSAQYFPGPATVRAVAVEAQLRNPHPSARTWLLDKIERPPMAWDERAVLTIPGVVWTVSSDTCATGRLSAPDNVAYDHFYREFVFRQPRNATELGGVMSADSEEVFACYRFDGLERWTSRSVAAGLPVRPRGRADAWRSCGIQTLTVTTSPGVDFRHVCE